MERFSIRHGYERKDADVTICHEAPSKLREAIISVAYQCRFIPSYLRSELCSILYRKPDSSNWSEFPNIDGEVHELRNLCTNRR